MPAMATGQGVPVFRTRNLTLLADEVFNTMITVQPYALHEIASDVSTTNAVADEEIVTITLRSEWALGGKGLVYAPGDRLHKNTTWTPRVPEYNLSITNCGYLDEVTINLTISQIGLPSITLVPFEDYLAGVIVPLAIIIAIPPFVFAVMILMFKRLRQPSSQPLGSGRMPNQEI